MAFDTTKALKHQVVLLSGEEELLRRRGLDDLLLAAGVDPDGFDTEVFDAGDAPFPNWVAACGTTPFLGDRRISLVRHVLRFDFERGKTEEQKKNADFLKPITEALKSLPTTALLILVADDESGDDQKQQKAAKTRAAWEKLVRAAGGYIEQFNVDPKNVRALLKAELVKENRKMSEAALETLTEMCGGSFSRAFEELKKLLIYTHGAASIQESDVRELVVPSREWNVFKLVDSIVGGQVPDSLRQIRVLVGSQNKAEDAAMRSIFPQMSRMLKLLWQGRLFIDGKCTPSSPTQAVIDRLPEKPNILKEKGWIQNKAMNGARNISLKQLARALEILAITDARMKGIETGFSGMDSLERMALEMVETFKS